MYSKISLISTATNGQVYKEYEVLFELIIRLFLLISVG